MKFVWLYDSESHAAWSQAYSLKLLEGISVGSSRTSMCHYEPDLVLSEHHDS